MRHVHGVPKELMKLLISTLFAALLLSSPSYAAPNFGLARADDGTSETFSLSNSVSGGTLAVLQGQTSNPVDLTVTSSNGFVVTTGGNSSTVLPVSYSCTGLPLAAQCNFSPNATTNATTVTLTISTQGPTIAQCRQESHRAILCVVLLPGFFGILSIAGSRTRSVHSWRLLGLAMAVGFCLLWLSSCGGSNGNTTSGTPRGSSAILVNATTGGANPITASTGFTLTVN